MYHVFVSLAREQGLAECRERCLDSLPAEAVAGLLAYARSDPKWEPRVYPMPERTTPYEPSPDVRAAQAQVLQWLEQYTARTGRGA